MRRRPQGKTLRRGFALAAVTAALQLSMLLRTSAEAAVARGGACFAGLLFLRQQGIYCSGAVARALSCKLAGHGYREAFTTSC